MMYQRGFTAIVVYLDDVLVIERTKQECQLAFDTLYKLLLSLGFQISPSKLVYPYQRLTFLGVVINTVAMELSLPQSKLSETGELGNTFASRKRAFKHQLQQLAGKLNWACRIVHGRRTFLCHIIDCMNALSSNSAKYLLTPEFCKDILWWQKFLLLFNGKCLLHSKVPIADVQTGACSGSRTKNPGQKPPRHKPLDKNPPCQKPPRQNILFRNFITFVFRMSYGKEISIWFLAVKYVRHGSIK